MDILLYLGIAAVAVILYIVMILERSWILGLIAIPFMAILIPVSWDITHMEIESLSLENHNRTMTLTEIYPSEMRVDAGTINSGNISSIQASDLNYIDIQEIVANPGILIYLTFETPCQFTPQKISSNLTYNGGAGHTIHIELQAMDSTWDEYAAISDGASGRVNGTIIDGEDHVGSSCIMYARYNHDENGNGGHSVLIDDIKMIGNIVTDAPHAITTIVTEERYNETWYLGVLWWVFLFTDVGLILLFYTAGDLADMFSQVTKRKDSFSKDREG